MDKKKKTKKICFLARFRWLIQAAAAVLTNIHLPNFFKGTLYQGKGNTPAFRDLTAIPAPEPPEPCPIGAFQAVIGSSKFKFSYYITGTLILMGVLLGAIYLRLSVPFSAGFRRLLHDIRVPKLSTRKLKPLRYLKYVILAVFVIMLPLKIVVDELGMGDPFFCKYICPQGVVDEGAIPLAIAERGHAPALSERCSPGKPGVLLAVVTASMFIYRPFCKWICPLGAVYALLNHVSLFQMKVDKSKCVSCGACAKACKMDVDVHKKPQPFRVYPLRNVHRLPDRSDILQIRVWK